uniref:sel1 repeat family protein n=1 Tax=Streptomyces sp. WELS2 TaxID=2749435 RepID=UPI0015F04F5C
LDGHLGDGGLEPRLLARLAGARTVVLATLREDAYDEYRQGPRGRVLDLARIVELPREWTAAERSRAAESADPRSARAAYRAGAEGIAAYLAVEPRLWADFQRARRRHPRGYALVRAAIDLARCGLRGSLPQDLVLEAHRTQEVPAGMDREPVADAWAWAAGERFGLLPLLWRRGPRAWEPVPCLVDMAEQEGGLPPVSGALRQRAVEVARENEAYDFRTVAALARAAFRDAAEGGDKAAMYRMGLLEESLGSAEEAGAWFRRAAEAGVVKAAGRLGRLLAERGEDREAEPFLELAAGAGDGGAATLLGKLLRDRAVRWLEAGAEQKDPEALHLLADLLFTSGGADRLWDLYHKASAAGRAEVARSIGMCHLVWNERVTGHVWLRRAADAGDEEAADMLEYADRPDPLEETLGYFAPSQHYPLDHAHYGAVLEEAGRAEEASDHYLKGYERGDSYAAYRLAVLLEKKGTPDEARTWYRKAADLGHPAALKALKALGEAPATPDTVEE